jgi:hypothetical protein
MISQIRAAQVSALPMLEPAQCTVSETPLEKGKMWIEGGDVFRGDSLTFWGFFPIMTLTSLVIWEFGGRGVWIFCARRLGSRRKNDIVEHSID